MVEQGGALKQCGDLAGIPQKPNNLLDDVYRVGFPRPANLDKSSVYYPATAPYDFQAIPCQEAFAGKTEIEVGIVVVGAFAPGVGGNQGPDACGGAGCPNDAVVKLRFVKLGETVTECAELEFGNCVCPDGTFGEHTCTDGVWPTECSCKGVEACLEGAVTTCACSGGVAGYKTCMDAVWMSCECPEPEGPTGACDDPLPFVLGPGSSSEVTISLVAASLQAVPWPPLEAACPSSKPPFALEYHYGMTVSEAGWVSVSYSAIPEPWDVTQYWLDMLGGCGVPLQCNTSSELLTGYAEAGSYVIGLTLAPPFEIYIPDQDFWNFAITVTWSPGAPPE